MRNKFATKLVDSALNIINIIISLVCPTVLICPVQGFFVKTKGNDNGKSLKKCYKLGTAYNSYRIQEEIFHAKCNKFS